MIYLWCKTEWKEFKLTDKKELDKREILIGYNARIGDRVRIGDNTRIGDDTTIGYNAIIEDSVIIGNNTIIGDNAKIGYGVIIEDNTTIVDNAVIGYEARIGYRTKIGNGAIIGYRTWIGNDTTIGYRATIGYNAIIEDGVIIGYGAKIGDGARIEDNTIPKIVYITGSKHFVNYWGENRIDIGCKNFTIDKWLELFESGKINELAKEANYNENQLQEYKHYIDFIVEIHKLGRECYHSQTTKTEN